MEGFSRTIVVRYIFDAICKGVVVRGLRVGLSLRRRKWRSARNAHDAPGTRIPMPRLAGAHPTRIRKIQRVPAHIRILVPALRVRRVHRRHPRRVRLQEPPELRRVVPRLEIIHPRLRVPFLPRKLIMIHRRLRIPLLPKRQKLPAPHHIPARIRHHPRRPKRIATIPRSRTHHPPRSTVSEFARYTCAYSITFAVFQGTVYVAIWYVHTPAADGFAVRVHGRGHRRLRLGHPAQRIIRAGSAFTSLSDIVLPGDFLPMMHGLRS